MERIGRRTIRNAWRVTATVWFCAALAAATVWGQDQGTSSRGFSETASTVRGATTPGRFYALVIGIDRYANLRQLTTAVHDADSVGDVLASQYGFAVTRLRDGDATRDRIVSALTTMRRNLTENDNFLIYYAGHGHFDRETTKGYWLLVDADRDPENTARDISADDITTMVRGLKARHVLIVSDSCYAGDLGRGDDVIMGSNGQDEFVRRMMRDPSRTLMASGGDEPVPDQGMGGHSIFAAVLLHALSQQSEPMFTAADLFAEMRRPIISRSPQTPNYIPLPNSMGNTASLDDGDFVFVRTTAARTEVEPPHWTPPPATSAAAKPVETGVTPVETATGAAATGMATPDYTHPRPLVEEMGSIVGQVTNPTGQPQSGGAVSFIRLGGGMYAIETLKVGYDGSFTGRVPPGRYKAIYNQAGMGPDQETDQVDMIEVAAGQTTRVDIDMSREEFVSKLSPEKQKQLTDMKAQNASAISANQVIRALNADLLIVVQDIKDADGARATAAQTLGAGASSAELDAKEHEIKTAKYTEIETMMLRDTAAKSDAAILWAYLGQAELGLRKLAEAETDYKRALDVDTTASKPNLNVQGMAQAGLGEVYARTGRVSEANAAYDSAAKLDLSRAGFYYRNEAIVFFQLGNGEAQVAAAEQAIQVDPTNALIYYLKGNGLVQKTTLDPKTSRLMAPPGCVEAYEKYLELAPNGPYASDVRKILAGLTGTVASSYSNKKQ